MKKKNKGSIYNPKEIILTNNMQQHDKDKIIQRQLRFQELLINISTKYINSDLSDIDKLINESLEQIGRFVESDRSYIFRYNFKDNTTSNTYEWCAEGIEPEIQNLQNIPIDFIPQWLERHQKGLPLYIEDVSKLPYDGELGLRGLLEPQGVKSLITIPKIKNNELIGFIGFDSVKKINKYTENEQEILSVYANMLVNIRQRKEYEDKIQQQQKEQEKLLLDLSQQNEQLNDYAHVVSHDLRSPLTNVHTLIHWYIEDRKDSLTKKDTDALNSVLFNVEKMDYLIKGILDYSTLDKLNIQDQFIDINSLLEEILQTILVPDHINLKIQKELPNLYGNSWRFKQLFQNLLSNAIKSIDKKVGEISIGCIEKENFYEFYIKDNGIGIKTNYFEHIFKIFNKLENTSSSSGIGLSIVKKIVTHYGGSIWLKSDLGKGTTFHFTIRKKLDSTN